MPSTITHSYFAMDVYDRLPFQRRQFLLDHKERMKQSGQSMDPLFFYHITNFKKGKDIRQFGHFFHTHQTRQFFQTLISYIKTKHYAIDPDVISYLYGMICHYVLDSTCHPYIIYFTGVYDKERPDTLKYNHLHGEWESLIDNYFVQERNRIKPWKFDCIDYCFHLHPLSDSLCDVIDFTFEEVFGIAGMSHYYEESLQEMKFFFQVFRKDFLGIKKIGYTIIDFFSPRTLLRKKVLSYHYSVDNKVDLLNLDHKKWCYPTNCKITSSESFLDLYRKSLYDACNMIHEVDSYLYQDKEISFQQLFKNKSYVTGLDCSKKSELKYFYF